MEAEGRRGRVTRSLDRSFPGLRFRIVDEQERIRPPHQVLRQRRPDLRAPGTPVAPSDEVAVIKPSAAVNRPPSR